MKDPGFILTIMESITPSSASRQAPCQVDLIQILVLRGNFNEIIEGMILVGRFYQIRRTKLLFR